MRVRFTIRGHVQGVGFRYFVQSQADSLGLSGWVRNGVDGSVLGMAEGSEDRMDAMKRALETAPPPSEVTTLDWVPSSGTESLPHPFEIRR
ncbi:MAG TPA: acylphosphatase [Holophagaceae bacterium]|nr:acylphosphatase [Holophagaceae bacterium]